MTGSNFNKHASASGGTVRELSQKGGWRESLGRFGMGALAISLMAFNVASYATDGDLLQGQILHIACNGDVTDQSDMKNSVENNGVTFGSDKFSNRNRACFFDGSDYLKIPKNAAFNLPNFTVAAWVLIEGSYNGEARAIVSNYDKTARSTSGSYQNYGIGIGTPGIANMFYDNGTGIGGAQNSGTSSIFLTDARWHHVAMVFQGGVNAKLYVDGELKKLGNGAMPASISPTGDLFIGRGGSTESRENRWYGSIDEVRILNRALSEDEVNRLSAIIDLPTGETFTSTGESDNENTPFLLNTKEGTVNSVMVTPNPDGSFSLNQTPSNVRDGERDGPSETSTFIINPDGSSTLLDEAQPGMTATINIFGDLEVTDVSVPDLKLILQRNREGFAFQSVANPSVVVTVNPDGTLNIVDESRPNVSILYNHRDGNYTVVDRDANTVTVIERNGNAVLQHPEAPGVVATFNVFDEQGDYTITDTTSNECLAMSASGDLRSLRSLKSLGKSLIGAIGSGVQSAITTVVSNGVQKVVTSLVSGGAKTLGSLASSAVKGFSGWWKCLPFIGKFAIVGGVVAVGAAIIGAIFSNNKLKKKIKQLQGQVQQLQGQIQTLTAVVQQQAETIRQLEATVAGQAQTIQRLETTIEELKQIIIQQAQVIQQQAETISQLQNTVEQQKEIIAKQAETIAAMEKRIADLEAKTKSANDVVEQIPDGVDPTATTKSRQTIRKTVADDSGVSGSPSECVKFSESPLVALKIVHADVVDNNQVVVGWQTVAELGNAGFNVYRAPKNADGQCGTNLTKVNLALIPSPANGVVENSYTYDDQTPRSGKNYCYGIESVDTEGQTFLFEERVVKAQGPSLITLSDFAATPAKEGILLNWETMSEDNTAGFNLWRAKAPADGKCTSRQVQDYTEVTKLNAQPMAATGGFMQGASYSYKDRQVTSKTSYCYGLEEISWEGMSIFYWSWLTPAMAR